MHMGTKSGTGLEITVTDSIEDVERDRWNSVVGLVDQGSVFHRYEWLQAIEAGLGYPARHLQVTKDGNMIGIWPNFVTDLYESPLGRLTSMYPGFGGPLITTDTKESLGALIERIPDICATGTVVHEIRANENGYLQYTNLLESRGYRPTRDGCRIQLELSDGYDAVREGMSRSRQRGIERGRQHDYEITERTLTPRNIYQFYGAYRQVMDRVGGDAFPLSFLEKLSGMESRLLLVTLELDGEYAGGMLEVLNEEQSTVYGFLKAVPEQYFEYNASELLYDYVIQWGIEHGYETYDMGYTSADFENGLFQFKKSFGGHIVPNLFWERGCSPVWPLVRAGREIYSLYYK